MNVDLRDRLAPVGQASRSRHLNLEQTKPLFRCQIHRKGVLFKRNEAFNAGDLGSKPGQFHWYSENFIQYISDLNYHIELTGDEIKPIGGAPEVRTLERLFLEYSGSSV